MTLVRPCGFTPPVIFGGTYADHFAELKRPGLLGAIIPTIPVDPAPNSVSTAYMFKAPPKMTRWYVTRHDGFTRDQVRYMFGLAFTDWKMLPLQFKEASSVEEATLQLEIVNGEICGMEGAIGCYNYLPDKPAVLQVLSSMYDPTRPMRFLETAVHEYGHHLGLLDGYMVTDCGGGPDYMGAMGFGEGSADRLGTRPSLHERSVVKKAAILRTFPRCN